MDLCEWELLSRTPFRGIDRLQLMQVQPGTAQIGIPIYEYRESEGAALPAIIGPSLRHSQAQSCIGPIGPKRMSMQPLRKAYKPPSFPASLDVFFNLPLIFSESFLRTFKLLRQHASLPNKSK